MITTVTAVQDLFVEAVDTALASHTPTFAPGGGGWSVSSALFTVMSATDLVQHGGVAVDVAWLGANLRSDDMDVSALVSVAGSTARLAGVCARMDVSSFTTQYEAQLIFKNATQQDVLLVKNVAGSRGTLGSAVVTLNAGVAATLKLSVRAGSQRVFVNDVAIIATTDADAALVGRQYSGIIMNGAVSSATLDNFLVEVPAYDLPDLRGFPRYALRDVPPRRDDLVGV